ncbi:MAG: HPr(Ser) kinase/phosphatase [Sandaracinaceae bacterium]
MTEPVPYSSSAATSRALLDHEAMAPIVTAVAGAAGLDRPVRHPRVQKSGLVLAGHTHGFVPTRVQVFGETEMTYLDALDPGTRRARLTELFGLRPSCLLVTRGIEAPRDLWDGAEASGTPLAVCAPRSSATLAAAHQALDQLLAPRERRHGVMVEVHGIGTLLLGPSGIGKSECALFLVERGHRLIADDQVWLTRLPNGQVRAAPAPLLRHHLEIRGLGILNVRDLFGATAVWDEGVVDLVAELCPWREDEDYDRLGLDTRTESIFGVQIPKLRIPVRPGRDMAVILEIAARNQLLKAAGHHAARDFARRLSRELGMSDPEEDLG